MGIQFYIYKAPPELGSLYTWDKMEAEALGSADHVKAQVAALYPQIKWSAIEKGWSGLGSGAPYLDVLITEHSPGQAYFIVFNKAPPSVMRHVMEQLGLNSVSSDIGDRVDPYAYNDDDRYYAKKE